MSAAERVRLAELQDRQRRRIAAITERRNAEDAIVARYDREIANLSAALVPSSNIYALGSVK